MPAGTLLKDVQTIESASGEKDATQYFARKIPFKDVGGKLRIRLVKVDCLPKDCQHGQKIYTRIILGKQSDYGSKLCECKESLATPRAGAASFYAKKVNSPNSMLRFLIVLNALAPVCHFRVCNESANLIPFDLHAGDFY